MVRPATRWLQPPSPCWSNESVETLMTIIKLSTTSLHVVNSSTVEKRGLAIITGKYKRNRASKPQTRCDLIAVTGRKYIRTGRWVNFLSNAGTPFFVLVSVSVLSFPSFFLWTNDPESSLTHQVLLAKCASLYRYITRRTAISDAH